MTPPRDRGQSGEQYVVIISGCSSEPLPRGRAIDRGRYHGEQLKQTVEVRRLRPDKKAVLVAAWKDGRQTK